MLLTAILKRGPALAAFGAFLYVLAAPAAFADLNPATDTNPDPNIVEVWLTADEQVYVIGGDAVNCMVYRDSPPLPFVPAPAGIPAPEISAKIGDLVIVHLTSLLEAPNFTSIHWHGIELDNNSDGTGVTQDHLAKNDSYVYRFRCPRAGIFWYHPHMIPPHQNHSGMYGSLIVRDATATTDQEGDLEAAGTIPTNVRTLVLSDINFDLGEVGGDTPGFDVGGTWKTVHEMITACAAAIAGGGMDPPNCGIVRGNTVMVNGVEVNPGAMTPKIFAKSGEGIRLRLINPSNTRYFRLAGRDKDDNHQHLYRIGGEGGFLDTVRLEGGTPTGYVTGYEFGEILLAPANRADIVIVPVGSDGDIIKIIGRQPSRGGIPPPAADYDVFFIEILGTEAPAFTILEGDDVLGPGATESLKALATTPLSPVPGGELGSTDETIRLTQTIIAPPGPGPSIDGVIGHFEDSGPDFMAVPSQDTSRYCECGDVLELTIKNETGANHPFHLHGFSFQPVRILDGGGATIFTYPYNEFRDVEDVRSGEQLVFRVRIDDRETICDDVVIPYACADSPGNGAVGRWVHHCHIFHHAALGMISELVVLPDTTPPVINCPADIFVECTGPAGTVVNFAATATDNCDPDVDIVCVPPSGTAFPLGVTQVTCTATDDAGNSSNCMFDVTVQDTIPPVVTVTILRQLLWPPYRGLIPVGFSATALDACVGPVPISGVAVYSDEPDGAAPYAPDAVGGLGTLRLRCERQIPGTGRIYVVAATATDGTNVGVGCGSSIVPLVPTLSNILTLQANATAAEAFCLANPGVPPPGFVQLLP